MEKKITAVLFQYGCSDVPMQSEDVCWNNLVCTGYIAGALENCCVISFDCCLWSYRWLHITSICFPCHATNMSRLFFHQGVFFPLKKWRLHGWCRWGKRKLSLFHSGEANIHYTTDKSFALNIGWDLNWDNLARTSFIWGRRHCCFEFGISQEQHHPSYLGRGRHLRGLHSGPSGKVNSTRWEVQWKDLMRRPCWRQSVKK